MKKILIVTFILFTVNSYSQGTKFFDGNWAETLKQAKIENKMIFVDVSTTWCRPCKKMKKEILPQKKVGDLLNSNFVNLSINAHNLEGLEFNLFYKINSYPTFIFLDKNGNIIQKAFGFKTADQLIKISNNALKLYDNVDELEKAYKAGKNNYAFIIKYIHALNKLDRPSEFLARNFLKSNKVREDIRLKFIFRTINSTQGKLFDELIDNIDKIRNLFKHDDVNEKVYSLFIRDIEKAGFSGDKKQVKKILKSVKKVDFLRYNELKLYAKLIDSERKGKHKKFIEYAEKYFDLIQNDNRKCDFIKSIYLKQINEKSLKNLAYKLAKRLYKSSNTSVNHVLLIKLAVLSKHFNEAETEIKLAYSAIEKDMDNSIKIQLKNYYNYLNKQKKNK